MLTVQRELIPTERPVIMSTVVDLDKFPPDVAIDSPPPDKSLIESITSFGIQQPVTVMDHENGLVIIDGRRRVKAARAAGMDSIPVRVITSDEPWTQTLSVQLNAVRKDNPLADLNNLLDLAAELARQGFPEEKVEKELARLTHLPRSTIWRRMQLRMLISPFFTAVREGHVKVSIAERLAKMPQEYQEAMLDVYRINGKLTSDDVAAARKSEQQAVAQSLSQTIFGGPSSSDLAQMTGVAAPTPSADMLAVIDAARAMLMLPKGHDKDSNAKRAEATAALSAAFAKLDGE